MSLSPANESRASSVLLALCAILPPLLACTPDAQRPAEPNALIPLEQLFAPVAFDAPQLSPDGTKIAYLAPKGGVANFFVAETGSPRQGRALTDRTDRGVQARDVSGNVMYRWSLDSRFILYPQDRNGDENWNLFAIDTETGQERDLTGLDGAQVELVAMSASEPSLVAIAIRPSMVEPPDIYRLDLNSGEREPLAVNGGHLAYLVDHQLRPRIALAFNAAGGIDILTSKDGTGNRDWQQQFSVSFDDLPAISATGYQEVGRFSRDNGSYYLYDSRGRNTIALVRLDLESGEIEEVATDERVDIGGVLYHPTEHRAQAYATNWTRKRWNAIDPAISADLDYLGNATEGEVTVVSRDAADERWIVRFTLAHEPETYYLYERGDEPELTELFVNTPGLAGLPLAKLHPVVTQSRDGLDLVSYLSLPPWLDADDDGRPEQPVPLVVLVHGGPSDERAQYGYGPFLHWLANRGYGVFYVNFRGSPGFGKDFVNAQQMEWGGKMHEDVLDQVDWAVGEGVTTADRVAIVGGSYGGYEVLVGMTMTPDVFACGVDLVGPSNLEIFMPHWNVDMMSRIIGDPRTEEGSAFLRSRSPINFASQARNPILIGQGANDSRVPQDQSDSMVKVLEEAGVEVTYVLYPDEGHGLLRQENNFSFWAIAEVFLGRCLGGRYQEIGNALEGASAQVLAGAQFVPGLEEALARRDG